MSRFSFFKTFLFLMAWAAGMLCNPALSQLPPMLEEGRNSHLIHTYGQAEVKVVPDRVTVILGVKTFGKALSDAYDLNTTNSQHVIAIGKKYNIDDKDIQTDYLRIDPSYRGDDYHSSGDIPTGKPAGYVLERSVAFILKDPKQVSNLIRDALDAGANSVQSVSFETSELRKYRDQARLMALKAAQEKAQLLADAVGYKIGKPTNISEGFSGTYPVSHSPGAQNAAFIAPGMLGRGQSDLDSEGGIALGQIVISSSINVTFELQ